MLNNNNTKSGDRTMHVGIFFRLEHPDPEIKKDKGLKGGSCNRQNCQAPNAIYYNHINKKYYCKTCAEEITRWNPEEFNDQLFYEEIDP